MRRNKAFAWELPVFSEVLNPADDWMYVMKSEKKVLEDGGLLHDE